MSLPLLLFSDFYFIHLLLLLENDSAGMGDTDGDKNYTASAKIDDDDDYDDDGYINLSTKTTPLTTAFPIHQCIVASVSTYFQSLFKRRKHGQTREHKTQTSIIKLLPDAIKYSWIMFILAL
jgi:hypothetical protein